MKDFERRILKGKELKSAALNGLPVFYTLYMHNPDDKHMNVRGKFYLQNDEELEMFYDKDLKKSSSNYLYNSWKDEDDCTEMEDEYEHTCYAISKIKY